ncbi:MAG TPA: SigE family RNA polymerase sigma factor [Candidatus Limnocylindrales bacterium]
MEIWCNAAGGRPVSPFVSAPDFETFYMGTRHRLLRYAYGLTGDLAEAQDLAQEAYARAWSRWRRLRRYDQPDAWLRLVVTRLATDRWRWLAVRREQPLPPEAIQGPPVEDRVLVMGALKGLPLNQRRALALRYLLDLSVAEIGVEMGANENTVRSWLARGRASLANRLGGRIHVS